MDRGTPVPAPAKSAKQGPGLKLTNRQECPALAIGFSTGNARAVYHRCMEHDHTGRVLAIDFGSVRVGLAISDALGLTAQGLPTLTRTTNQSDLAHIGQIASDYSVARIIVGNPISNSGDETAMSRRARRFAGQVHEHLNLPVELWDERLTSLEADHVLRESGSDRRKQPGIRDRVAAQILLQSYLDRRALERAQTEITGARAES
jgi:putative holliday junction resolvase